MKKCLLISIYLLFFFNIQAQDKNKDDKKFERKGRFLIETGYNLAAGFSKGTGINVLIGQGNTETLTSIGFEGGYFVSNRLAVKFNLGVYASSFSLANFSIGPKYYIIDQIPIELGVGILNVSGQSTFQLNLNMGYAINLADNITIEPKIGILGSDGLLVQFGTKFALFL